MGKDPRENLRDIFASENGVTRGVIGPTSGGSRGAGIASTM